MTQVIEILQCPDSLRWYSHLVGQTVRYIPRYDSEIEYGSRDTGDYINFVLKTDGRVVEISDEV